MDMNSATLDLTRGSVPLCLIRFSFPLLLANLLQSFYSMAAVSYTHLPGGP